jgi:predicted acyl esterase
MSGPFVSCSQPNSSHEILKVLADEHLWATSHVFLPGPCLRVEISSSHFPRFDRNLNTGEDQATSSRMPTATQTVFHDQRYPSHILLPVIPR